MSANIAAIGSGYWGKNIVRNLHDLGTLACVCDNNAATLRKFQEEFRVPGLADFNEVLRDPKIQGVAIATPAITHYTLVREALEAGKDVFVEKPLSLHGAEGAELVRLAEDRKRILMVGHILQYHPAAIKLKQLVKEGVLGKIQFIHSSRLNIGKLRSEENILWSFAPHDISLILMLLDETPASVHAFGGDYIQRGIFDTSFTMLKFPSGATAQLFVSWLHPFKEQKLVVVGEKQMAVFDDMAADKLVLYGHKIEWLNRVPVARKAEGQVIPLDASEPLKEELKEFLSCIQSRKTPKTDGKEGLRVLKVLEAAEKSLLLREAPAKSESEKPAVAKGAFVHESAVVDAGVRVGEGTKVWHFSHLGSGAQIGDTCVIGQNVFIADGVQVGNHCKIQNNVSLYTGVILEENVFCGPSCVFTNVINPRAHIERKTEFRPTLVKKGATIGANATIVCGHTLGAYSLIGAGAVVTKDVPDYALMLGVPAQIAGWVCQCGTTLDFKELEAVCRLCQSRYRQESGAIVPVSGKVSEKNGSTAAIPMLDLRREYLASKRAIDQAIERTLDHQQWILGPEVKELEQRVASSLGTAHAIGVGSGTDALVLALRALAIRRKGKEYFDRTDEIITTTFSFTATGDAILRSGATPVFVDIDPRTFNMDPSKVKAAMTPHTVGIIPVHLYGQACAIEELQELARSRSLFIVEDVAQAYGGAWKGKKLGTFGDLGCFSFFPSKNLGAYGDAGMVITADVALADLVRQLLKHGGKDKYNVDHIGYNSRLDTLQAAILLARLDSLDGFNERRRAIARAYSDGLRGIPGIQLPSETPGATHVYHQFTLRCTRRDALAASLKSQGIQSMVYYPVPLHQMKVFEGRSRVSGSLQESESASREVLSLPVEPLLEPHEIQRVIEAVRSFAKIDPAPAGALAPHA